MDTPSETFEWATVTADALAALFPRLGLFAADDVVAFRDQYGSFPDAATMVSLGVDPGLAEQLWRGAGAGDTLGAVAAPGPELDAVAPPASGSLDDPQPAELDPLERFRVRSPAVAEEEAHALDAERATAVAAATTECTDIESRAAGGSEAPQSGEDIQGAAAEEVADALVAGGGVADESVPLESAKRSPGPPPLPATAVSESALSTKPFSMAPRPSLPAASIDAVAESRHERAPKAKRRVAPMVIAVLAVCNVATIVGMGFLTMDGRRARAPVAALSAEVSGLRVERSGFRTRIDSVNDKLEDTRASIDDARVRLDRQERALTSTIETVEANAQRQKAFEREARARDAREERELNSLKSRMSGVERRVDHLYSLKEALQVIDRVHGEPAPARSR